jgi:hypothetical protein
LARCLLSLGGANNKNNCRINKNNRLAMDLDGEVYFPSISFDACNMHGKRTVALLIA